MPVGVRMQAGAFGHERVQGHKWVQGHSGHKGASKHNGKNRYKSTSGYKGGTRLLCSSPCTLEGVYSWQ